MKRNTSRLTRGGVGVSALVVVILAGWGHAVVGTTVEQGAIGTPPLRLLVDNESPDLLNGVPATLALAGFSAVNGRGDWVFAPGAASAVFLRRRLDDGSYGPLERLLQTGDPVPGLPLGVINWVSALRINEEGLVCALIEVSREHSERAVVTHDGTELRKVVASSDRAPDGRIFGRNLGLVGINLSEDVAFAAPMTPFGSAAPAEPTVFVAPGGGAPVRLVGPGDTAPDTGGGTLEQISGALFNNRGEVLFRAAINGGSGGFGYFVASLDASGGAVVRKVVATGDNNLDGGTFGPDLPTLAVRFNNVGQVAIIIAGRLYVSSPETGLALVAKRGQSMPEPFELRTLSGFTSMLALSDSGWMALAVGVSDTLTSQGVRALLRYRPGVGLQVLAHTEQQAPVPEGQPDQWFYGFSDLSMNTAGDVSFRSLLAPPTPAAEGVFKVTGDTVSLVALYGTPAPSSLGGTFANLSSPILLDAGGVFVESSLRDTATARAAFLFDGFGPQVLASNADPVPEGSRVAMRNLFMGGPGTATMFVAARTGSGETLWMHDAAAGETTRVVAEGDEVPGEGWLSSVGTRNHYLTASGDVVFPGSIWGRPGTFLFSWSQGTGLQKLVGPGDSAPGTTAFFSSCDFASLLVPPFNQDTAVFRGSLNDGTNGIFLVPVSGGPVARIVVSTDPAPGGGTFTSGSSTTLNYPYINSSGHVAFWGLTSEGTSGIFIGEAGTTPIKVAVTGDDAPGGGTFSAFALAGPAGFDDSGQVVFFATVTDGTGGLFAGTAGGPVQAIALAGQAAPSGGTYAFTGASKDARVNARGDVLFQAPLAGGTANSGLFLRRHGSSGIETVALAGQEMPGTGFSISDISVTINNYPGEMLALGPAGEALFTGSVNTDGGVSGALFRYGGPGTLSTVLVRGEPLPGASDVLLYFSQGPGAGGEGLFFLSVRSVNGGFRDAIYALDTLPPTLAVSAEPSVLWTMKGKPRPVTISGLAADSGTGVAGTLGTYQVIDEYGLVQPSGTFTVGTSGSFSFVVMLEATRRGPDRDGRLYDVRVTVQDAAGNTTTTSAHVVVPFNGAR